MSEEEKHVRWRAELYIGKVKNPDAIFSSASKSQAVGGILNYVFSMVEPDEPFKIVVRPIGTSK